MNASCALRRTVLTLCLFLAAAAASAQAQQITKPYEPSVGQQGKDVVWVPTSQALVDKMLDIANVTAADFVIDLGSGDGRTVISAAKRGARALGVEFNPEMAELSRQSIAQAGVEARATIIQGDLFEADLSEATVITMFLLPSINLKLRPKILDLEPGTRIVSNTFTMENWEADETATISDGCTSWCTALLWYVPAKVEGTWSFAQSQLSLTQQFQMISGTAGPTPISNGRMRGNRITFRAGSTEYTGSVERNTMQGTTSGGGTWTAERR
jgi:precorrin-6B methylase 2